MKVLHVYSHDNPRLAMYVSLLSRAMPPDVECVSADNVSDIRRAMNDFQPGIIHQHGRFPVAAVAGTRDCPHPCRLVVSPHGERVDTRTAYAVIARSPYELDTHKMGRAAMGLNPLITRTITFQEAAAAIVSVYRRVIDSHPLEHLSPDARHQLAVILKAGLLGDARWVDNVQYSMFNAQWPHLYIYAMLENVLDIVQRGMDILGIDAPEAPAVDCYLPDNYQKPLPLTGAAVVDLLHDIEKSGVTLLRLTELTKVLHDDNLDEEALMSQTDAEKLTPLLQSVLQVLSEQTLLTEGFMPCAPADDNLTQNLRLQIENHLRLL